MEARILSGTKFNLMMVKLVSLLLS